MENHSLLCAVDGSPASDMAFESALNLMQNDDRIVVFHAYSPTKDHDLPYNLRSPVLEEKYENMLLSRFLPERYSLMWRQRYEGTVKKLLSDAAEEVSPHFIVVGYTGRKGFDKKDGPTTCGSNTDFALRHIRVPSIIIKYALPEKGPKEFLFAIKKQTELCRRGLDTLLNLMAPIDKLTVIYIDDGTLDHFGDDNLDNMKSYYEERLAARASEASSFRVIPKEGGTVAEKLFEAIDSIDPEFCCVAPRAKEYTGSFTEKIILTVRSNVILLK